jgi:hypothetical protein
MSGTWRASTLAGWDISHHWHPCGYDDETCCLCDFRPCEQITADVMAGHAERVVRDRDLTYSALLREAVQLGYTIPDPWATVEGEL